MPKYEPIAAPVSLTHEFVQWFRKANHTGQTADLRADLSIRWDERGLRKIPGIPGARSLYQMHLDGDIIAKTAEPNGHRYAHFLLSTTGRFRVRLNTYEMSLTDDIRTPLDRARDHLTVAQEHMALLDRTADTADFAFFKVRRDIEDAQREIYEAKRKLRASHTPRRV